MMGDGGSICRACYLEAANIAVVCRIEPAPSVALSVRERYKTTHRLRKVANCAHTRAAPDALLGETFAPSLLAILPKATLARTGYAATGWKTGLGESFCFRPSTWR